MCPSSEYSRKNASIAHVDNLLQLVNHIPSDAPHLTITGGEPFLLGKDIFRFFEAIRNKFTKTAFLLLTNGRIFSIQEYCDFLQQTLPPQTILGIPIHGYDAVTHDGVTQAPGSFHQTVAGLKNLLARGFRIELRIVVSQITAPYIDKIAELIIKEFPNVEAVKVIGLEMLGNAAKNHEQIWVPYSVAFQKSKGAIVSLISAGIDVGLYNFPLCAVDQEFWSICAQSITDYKVRFSERCNSCIVKDACGGIFAGTYRLAKDNIAPVGDKTKC
jgi:His-Xaa-Ser system radical SAM maturase HxsC